MFELWKIYPPRTRNTDDVSLESKSNWCCNLWKSRGSTRDINAMW